MRWSTTVLLALVGVGGAFLGAAIAAHLDHVGLRSTIHIENQLRRFQVAGLFLPFVGGSVALGIVRASHRDAASISWVVVSVTTFMGWVFGAVALSFVPGTTFGVEVLVVAVSTGVGALVGSRHERNE